MEILTDIITTATGFTSVKIKITLTLLRIKF